jgi:integrase
MSKARVKVRYRHDRQAWEVDYRDHDGRRCRPLLPTEEDALGEAAEIRKSLGQRTMLLDRPDRNITVKEYAETWLKTVASELEQATLRSYRRSLGLHVLPALGSLRLRDLRRRHVKALLNTKRADGYAPNGVRLMKAALSSMLTDAVDDELVDANAALQVGRKKHRAGTVTSADRVQNVKPMNWDQRTLLLDAAMREPRWAAFFATLAKAGLRPGEAFALKPSDIDFHDRTLEVERAASFGRVKATKTHERRSVDLSPDLLRLLERHLVWLKTQALKGGWGEPEWLFPNDVGRLQDKWVAGKAFRRLLKTAGLPGFRLYDLRHTYASLLLAAGAPITYVSAQLGHANPTTTLRYYAKWIPSKGRRWVEVLDGADLRADANFGTRIWNQTGPAMRVVAQAVERIGEPSGDRTQDPLIKSQVLYHLS